MNNFGQFIQANTIRISTVQEKKAGAELGQAQLKLGLDFALIFCTFVLVNQSYKGPHNLINTS